MVLSTSEANDFELGWLGREPFRGFLPGFVERLQRLSSWPRPAEYDDLVVRAEAPRFVAYDAAAVRAAGGYEAHVARYRQVPTREQRWHDFFNMAVWAHLPKTRWALNALHLKADRATADPCNGRTRVQNLAAQFDECGLIVLSSDPSVLSGLRELRFKEVLWERRAALAASTRFVMLGHGSLESLLRPHVGLTGKALFVPLTEPPPSAPSVLYALADDHAVRAVAAWSELPAAAPSPVHPLPLLGIPRWFDRQNSEFYDNPRYFRSRRRVCCAPGHVGNSKMG